MTAPSTAVPLLRTGDVLTQEEFLRRWEALPHVKRAELIGGVVHMPSPVSIDHGSPAAWAGWWLTGYRLASPGVEVCLDTTWLMGADVAQPDAALFILPQHGGRARRRGALMEGAPELALEVCVTSAAYDLGDKLALYERMGVTEYLTFLVEEGTVRRHRLSDGRYTVVPPSEDGVHRSTAFPGLWLDAAALLGGDLARVLAVATEGTRSEEHGAFVARLAAQRT